MLLSILIFIIVLSILVFVHELGHFAVAKWTGMKVDEFALGFPPRIWAKKKGETTYALNAIPFGGYVKIHGENPDQQDDDDPRSFDQKPVWARIAVVIAGVTMNMLFALVVLTVAYSVGFVSLPQDLEKVPGAQVTKGQVIISAIEKDSPADRAGLQPGDILLSLKDPSGQEIAISSIQQLVHYG